jgi:hypothetical protein
VGLLGTYAEGNHVRRVQLGFSFQLMGDSGERWYADVTDLPDAEYEALVRRFLEAVIAGDREAAARRVSFPLRINGRCPRSIPNRARLFEHWESIFTPAYLARLRTAIPHEMFARNGSASVGVGDVWFDGRGAIALNFAGCPLRGARRPAS